MRISSERSFGKKVEKCADKGRGPRMFIIRHVEHWTWFVFSETLFRL